MLFKKRNGRFRPLFLILVHIRIVWRHCYYNRKGRVMIGFHRKSEFKMGFLYVKRFNKKNKKCRYGLKIIPKVAARNWAYRYNKAEKKVNPLTKSRRDRPKPWPSSFQPLIFFSWLALARSVPVVWVRRSAKVSYNYTNIKIF